MQHDGEAFRQVSRASGEDHLRRGRRQRLSGLAVFTVRPDGSWLTNVTPNAGLTGEGGS